MLTLNGIAQWIGDNPATLRHVVGWTVQMAVQPEPGSRKQIIQRIAKAGGARHQAITRIGTAQAGRKVGDHHGRSVKRPGQRLAQPVLALQAMLAHGIGQQGLTVAQGMVFSEVKIGIEK